jgi:hypothetical protein
VAGLFCLMMLPAGVLGQDYTAGPGLAIIPIDDGYDGTLDPNSMASSTISVPSDGKDLIRGVSAELTMSTLFLGEFIIKLQSPTGTIVTLMHRAGLEGIPDDGTDSNIAIFGDGSNLSFQFPITFDDAAPSGIGAELMGTAPVDLSTEGVVGDPNDPRGPTPDNYIPDAGDLSTLNGGPLVDKFSAFDNENAVGDWILYLGDGAPGGPPYVLELDQWTLQLVTYAPGDFDDDGVPDGNDACPDTPPGDPVDPNGCSTADDDADGVLNDQDLCPDTPACADPIDPNGCPTDSDGDGVVDGCDLCPGTAPGDPVDPNGCSTADDDADGVLNDQDLCPDTPACADPIDPNGCPTDSDGDGVVDGCDLCPDTAPGDPVDPNGCSTADDDADGVLNDQDLCPNTPACADPIDPNGCPADSDGDGVVDGCDLCPGTASGEPVDSDGCSTADADDDGVPDVQDLCPDTPDCATDIDADGCAIDSDGDLVPDGCDICEGFDDSVDSDGDGVPDGCDTPPGQDTPTGCCGGAGPVSPICLAVGMLLLSRFGGYRTGSRRRD